MPSFGPFPLIQAAYPVPWRVLPKVCFVPGYDTSKEVVEGFGAKNLQSWDALVQFLGTFAFCLGNFRTCISCKGAAEFNYPGLFGRP